ncbi:hypothetical protein [Bacteroides faecalis]|uniref:hypothetical protein n=1 Tax=Bacteroides faecalis TaxID=2447885 RepID=UPI001F303C46
MDVFRNRHTITIHFENDQFDWFAFNDSIINEHLTDSRKTITIDLSYIPKSRVIKHYGLVTFAQVVQETISTDWKSWASESLTSTTMNV